MILQIYNFLNIFQPNHKFVDKKYYNIKFYEGSQVNSISSYHKNFYAEHRRFQSLNL